jgi:hypothetical protein
MDKGENKGYRVLVELIRACDGREKNIFVRNGFPDGKFSLLSYGRYSNIPLPL